MFSRQLDPTGMLVPQQLHGRTSNGARDSVAPASARCREDTGRRQPPQATDATLFIGEGTLYPALHRLERRGLIKSEWGLSDNNRQAKFYSLAKAGRARLQTGSSSWHRFVDVAGRALRATAPAAT